MQTNDAGSQANAMNHLCITPCPRCRVPSHAEMREIRSGSGMNNEANVGRLYDLCTKISWAPPAVLNYIGVKSPTVSWVWSRYVLLEKV